MSARTASLRVSSDCDKTSLFTPELRAETDRQVAKYPAEWKQSAVLPAFTLVQEVNGGWLSRELMDSVAAHLDMPKVAVYEVATLYSRYDLEPTVKNKVCICNSVFCMLCGSEELSEQVERKNGVKPVQTTVDGRFTLKEVKCLGACRHAPAVLIGKRYHENLSAEALGKLIEGLK